MVLLKNIYLNGTKFYKGKISLYFFSKIEDIPLLQAKEDGVYLSIPIDYGKIKDLNSSVVNTSRVGMTIISEVPFENLDTTQFVLSKGFLDNQRILIKWSSVHLKHFPV